MPSLVHVPLMEEEQVHSTPLNDLIYEVFRKRIASSPFAFLDIRQSRAEGNFSMFHLSKNGEFTSCKFPSNVRVYGRNTTVNDDTFFVECQTFSNSVPSSITAIFIGSNKGFGKQKTGLYTNPHLVLIQDIIFESNRFHLCFHSLRENINLQNSFQEGGESVTSQLKIPRKEQNKLSKHREYTQDGKKFP